MLLRDEGINDAPMAFYNASAVRLSLQSQALTTRPELFLPSMGCNGREGEPAAQAERSSI